MKHWEDAVQTNNDDDEADNDDENYDADQDDEIDIAWWWTEWFQTVAVIFQ